jgi:hypothetical protein
MASYTRRVQSTRPAQRDQSRSFRSDHERSARVGSSGDAMSGQRAGDTAAGLWIRLVQGDEAHNGPWLAC